MSALGLSLFHGCPLSSFHHIQRIWAEQVEDTTGCPKQASHHDPDVKFLNFFLIFHPELQPPFLLHSRLLRQEIIRFNKCAKRAQKSCRLSSVKPPRLYPDISLTYNSHLSVFLQEFSVHPCQGLFLKTCRRPAVRAEPRISVIKYSLLNLLEPAADTFNSVSNQLTLTRIVFTKKNYLYHWTWPR